MSNMSYEQPGMEIMDEKKYRDDRYRDDTEDFDAAMDEHAPVLHDALQNRDSLLRGIINGTAHPSSSKGKRTSRRAASHSTSVSLTPTNTGTPRSSVSASHHNGHVRHVSASVAVNGTNGTHHGMPTVDEISKFISRLASERQKTADLQGSLAQAHADAQFHAKRLDDAETRIAEARRREAENAKRRKAMEIEVSKMREQLRFVKVQYEGAVAEIKKAQSVIDALEEERGKAVDEARREREKVRILEEERKLKEAREEGYAEGKRLGMEEGVKRGATEGKRYGVKDGREAERERQKKAMKELVEDDEVYEPRPRESERGGDFALEPREPREVYHRVGDEETPGVIRSKSLNVGPGVAPVVTIDPRTHTANVMGLPLLETGNPSAAGYPSTAPANLSRHPSAPIGSSSRAPNGVSRDNPNINIIAGGYEDEPIQENRMNAPDLSMESALGKRDNRTSAPPRINTSSVDRDRPGSGQGHQQQRSWGGGIIGNGQGYRAPIRQRSDSGGASGLNGVPKSGHGSATPPSASTLDRSTPLHQYDILGDGSGGYAGGLMQQVNEMTPIMEAGSEPGPTPTQAYFNDAAMGVRPSQAQQEENERKAHERRLREQELRDERERERFEQERFQQQQQNQRWQGQQPQDIRGQGQPSVYVPPQKRTPQPSPTNPTGPNVANDWRRKEPAANGPTRAPPGQRKPVPGADAAPGNTRGRAGLVNVFSGHGRAGSADMFRAGAGPSGSGAHPGIAGGHSLPPIEIFPGTPPEQANARSTKMAQAGSKLMGSPAFVTTDIGYSADPGAPNSQRHGREPSGVNDGGRGHPGRGEYGPHGTPPRSPRPRGSELRNDFGESDTSGGGPHRQGSRQQQHGNAQRGHGHRRGAMSMGGASDHGPPQQPPSSPTRFSTGLYQPPNQGQPQSQPPSSPSRFINTNLAQPTPRHAVNPLDMSPEDIMIHPSGLTPTPTRGFDTAGGPPGHTNAAKGKAKTKPSAQVKQMRRQGYVDYDDEIPEDLTMGYSVRDQDPPMTTRSRVQSMYGISEQNGNKRTPAYEDAPLPMPKKTPAYEDAPLPPPKSARMMTGGLPQQHGGGFAFGMEPHSAFGRNGEPMPSPIKSISSSQIKRDMEDELDRPIVPYDHEDTAHDHNRYSSTIDILEEKAERWEPRSGTFVERKLPRSYGHDDVEVVPPPNASPQNRPVRQDASFLGTASHPPPPPSPGVAMRGPASAYVDTRGFDDSSLGPIRSNQPNSFIVDQHGNPVRSPLRQSMPITASARSSTSAMPLPPVQPNDIPWATGKTTTSQLPRPETTYESAPPSATVVPNTSTTWGYVRDSGQSLAPLGPLSNGGLGFSVGGGMANQTALYNLANASPVSTGRAQLMPLPSNLSMFQNPMASARSPAMALPPPGSTRSNIMNIPGTTRSNIMNLPPPGSTRSNIMSVVPGTARSMAQPLPPPSQSQIMLAGMLSPQGPGPEMDEDPIIPAGVGAGGAKKKKAGKKKK